MLYAETKKKVIIPVVAALALAITLVLYGLTYSKQASDLRAKNLVEFSQNLVDNWYLISGDLGIESSRVYSNDLSPLIPPHLRAMDLSIYGSYIVNDEYKELFEEIDMKNLLLKTQIDSEEDKSIRYEVGGIKLEAMIMTDPATMLVFYSGLKKVQAENLKKTLTELPSEYYAQVNPKLSGDSDFWDNYVVVSEVENQNEWILGLAVKPTKW